MAWRSFQKIAKQPLIAGVALCVFHLLYTYAGTYIFIFSALLVGLRILYLAVSSSVDPNNKAVLITGCDSGFGFDLARKLSTRPGTIVIAGCLQRNSEGAATLAGIQNVRVIKLDITDDNQVTECVNEVEEILKLHNMNGLWAVVNNAGVDTVAVIELATVEEYKQVAEVNIFGTIRVTKAVLPLIRRCKGRVIFNTSARGRMSQAQCSVYSITKHALECFADTLRREMKKFNVKVSLVEPGNFCGITTVMENIIKRLKITHQTMWEQASDEVKAAYGENYFPNIINTLLAVKNTSCPTTDPITEAFEDALWSGTPHARYMIHGSRYPLDKYPVMATLNPYLPEYIMDWIITRIL